MANRHPLRYPTRIIATVLLAHAPAALAQARAADRVVLTPGLVITKSVTVVPRQYRLFPSATDSAVIVIRGSGITVDFAGAGLRGDEAGSAPDAAAGVAVRVEGGAHVTIRNARIRGYRFGILAIGTKDLVIDNVDASNTWKPRLFSLVEHESLVDWLSFHHNERGEWRRFGAAFLLEDVTGGRVTRSRAEQGMNGLMLVRTSGVDVRSNDFSFNSGLGVGLYRSSHNTIVGNRIDFDVRGQSDPFYHRGQDSSGLLFFEQSSDNVVAYNSATHGGDGFFLWAGQQTMDTGEGGANDNVLFGNDFSFASANGIEATFARNTFVGNRLEGNDYGIWGGYSYQSKAAGNCFIRNRVGVAIEHGQANAITGNSFDGDTTAVSLWANPVAPSDWVYPRKRDTRSREYLIEGNAIIGSRTALRVLNTEQSVIRRNKLTRVDSAAVMRDTSHITLDDSPTPLVRGDRKPGTRATPCTPDLLGMLAPPIRARATSAGTEIPAQPLARLPRTAIVVDEWGPFDWRSPKLWPVDSVRSPSLRLRVLGPVGAWRVVSQRGLSVVSRTSGRVGDTLVVTPARETFGDWAIELEYVGRAVTLRDGTPIAAGRPVRFAYERFEPSQAWAAAYFRWNDSTAADSGAGAATRALTGAPMLTRTLPRLDHIWYRPAMRELPQANWAMDARATIELPSGDYTLRTISDDGIRVWVDGVLVIDRWTHHESVPDHASLTGGRHDVRVQYFQSDGWSELRVDFIRGVKRSTGSPGPH